MEVRKGSHDGQQEKVNVRFSFVVTDVMMLHREQTEPFNECKTTVSQNRHLTRFVCRIYLYGV